MGGPQSADEVYARASRVAISQGLPTTHPGDTLFNLITFSRTWIRPWAFYAIEDKSVRDALLALFPDGCYVAFAVCNKHIFTQFYKNIAKPKIMMLS